VIPERRGSGALGRPDGTTVTWRRYGDLGVLLEVADGDEARRWCEALEQSGLDARAGWSSVLIESPWSVARLLDALARVTLPDVATNTGDVVEIPVRYDGEDLAAIAGSVGITVGTVVARHSAPTYTVVCLGFSRAFPYLSGLDPSLRLPRHPTPRTVVPAGSVAIAADQAGIYPQSSPGGWHLLGTTSLVLFDEDRTPPSLLQPGDRVRFVPTEAAG
jgi:KipI family sensor histidine kinase inhibitor